MKIVKIKDWIESKNSKTKYRFSNKNRFPYFEKSNIFIFSIEKIYVEDETCNIDFCYIKMNVEVQGDSTNCFQITVPKIYLTYNNQPSLLLEIAKTLFGFEEIF